MMNSTKIQVVLASSFFFGVVGVYADQSATSDVGQHVFSGSYQTVIELNDSSALNENMFTLESRTNTKIISLMRLVPTAEMIARAESIAERVEKPKFAENDYSAGIIPFHKSPTAHELGMNDVPVLDQGAYGTCVTFAATAALDALLGRGDFVDQQCSLALNLALGNDYWNGAYYASEIIDPLKTYGVVEKNKCTAKYAAPNLKVKPDVYKTLIDQTADVSNVNLQYHSYIVIDDVRHAIDAGRRVSIGFELIGSSFDPISVQGFDIKVEGKKNKGGLWACKQTGTTRNYCGYAMAGHEVVITGYDDGQKLLKIRNSWATSVGDAGDFYMTYEFFAAMAIDGTEVWLSDNT